MKNHQLRGSEHVYPYTSLLPFFPSPFFFHQFLLMVNIKQHNNLPRYKTSWDPQIGRRRKKIRYNRLKSDTLPKMSPSHDRKGLLAKEN